MTPAPTPARGGTRWILIVIGLLVGNILAMAILIAATRHDREQVLPGYREELKQPKAHR